LRPLFSQAIFSQDSFVYVYLCENGITIYVYVCENEIYVSQVMLSFFTRDASFFTRLLLVCVELASLYIDRGSSAKVKHLFVRELSNISEFGIYVTTDFRSGGHVGVVTIFGLLK